jgi:hypothetical protein
MKTLKEFMAENNITAFEGTNNLIINVMVGEIPYGLDVDTSNIICNTQLTTYTNFSIEDNIINVENIILNADNTYLLQ